MTDVLALIPARAGSKGIPNKNFRELRGTAPVMRAYACAIEAGCEPIVSTDRAGFAGLLSGPRTLRRPRELAQDDTPMIDVVTHALGEIPGPPDQIILLVQPTQPLRQPKHLRAAIDLLESSGADSVVSVVEVPAMYHHHWQFGLTHLGELIPCASRGFEGLAARRQILGQTWIRDGTVYAFRRDTVTRYGHIYGLDIRPLIIPPEETCALDDERDWLEAERRLRALSEVP